MKVIEALDGQSIFDIALQNYGNAEAVERIIIDNPTLSITGTIAVGTRIKITDDDDSLKNKSVLEYFTKKNIKPANADNGAGEGGIQTEEGENIITENGLILITEY
jgi:hypothetical protein